MSKRMTLAKLIAETYTDSDTKFYVLCDAGNGSAFGEAGCTVVYDDDAAERYGAVEMSQTLPHMSNDRTECNYASDWLTVGSESNPYRVQIRF